MVVIANLELARRFVGETDVVKATDDAARMRAQLRASEETIRRKFEEVVTWLRAQNSLEDIERALSIGASSGAIVGDVDTAARALAAQINEVFAKAAADVMRSVSSVTGELMHFDVTNHLAIDAMQRNTLEVVQGLVEEQRATVRAVQVLGLKNGTNPRVMAAEIRDSIGLTEYDVQIVENYRAALRTLDPRALDYELRDGRYDRPVARAIENRQALSNEQIDRYVDTYRRNRIAFRAEVIARTEGLRALHEGAESGLQQAIDAGKVDAALIERVWYAAHDPRTRSSHRAMQGQKRAFGAPFKSGDGFDLRYPGDPNAPIEETANCRCVVATRIRRAQVPIGATP